MNTPLSAALQSYAAGQEVTPRWFLDSLAWVKATGDQTGDHLSLVEHLVPPGSASPWHIHRTEDESFYVVEGHLTVIVGDRRTSLRSGGYAFGQRGVAHGFRVEGTEVVRLLLATTGGDFAKFILEASVPATSANLPEPSKPDVARLTEIAARHGIEILGPIPQ